MDQGFVRIRDRPAPFWLLGFFLLAGGMLGIAMPLGLATHAAELTPWERLAAIALGAGVCAGALWWLARSPATEVQIDRTRRVLRIVRWGLSGRRIQQLHFDQLGSAFVERRADTDGGPVWRPALRLRAGDVVLMSELWSHDERSARATVATVAEVCRVPVS